MLIICFLHNFKYFNFVKFVVYFILLGVFVFELQNVAYIYKYNIEKKCCMPISHSGVS